MARLPGVADLGNAPIAAQTRPIASYDVSPVSRAGAALAEGGRQLGAGIMKAGEGAADAGLAEERWQYAQAHADFATRKMDLDEKTRTSSDYGPDENGKALPQRYQESVSNLQSSAAALIQSGPMRDRFLMDTRPVAQQGFIAAQQHARSQENDANIAHVAQQGDAIMDRAVKAPDDASRVKLIDAHNQLVDGLLEKGAITEVRAVEMKRSWAHQYATADLLHRADTDPLGVINELRAAPGSGAQLDSRIMQIEGAGKDSRSSAVGGFINETWLGLIKERRPDLAAGKSDADILALRADAGLRKDMTAAYREQNAGYLQKQGLEATPGNIYLAHFLGPAGAAAVLKASPNMPVQDALAKAVGPDKAQAMITANPDVLGGKLVGSVTQWANGKMGGAAPGGGAIYDMLRPDVREQLLAHAQTQLQKRTVSDLSDFKARIDDSQAEAYRTGNVTAPLQLSDFVGHLGPVAGPKAYADYQSNVAVGRDAARIPTMNPDQLSDLLKSYEPKPGPGYEAQAARQDQLRKAAQHSLAERTEDPGGYAVSRLPGTGDAYKAYQASLAPNPAAAADGTRVTPEAAARKFVTTTLLEQEHAGIPPDARKILPKADVDRFNAAVTAAAASDDPKARVGLVKQIQDQAAIWGDAWPQVMGQLAPTAQPIVRAIAAGADVAAVTRLLNLDPKENPAALLKEQNETKSKDLRTALNNEMAPFLQTMVGRQRDRDFLPYYNMSEKLAALYVRDGKDATTAAHDAFAALVGNRYDFRDTFRIPKVTDGSYTPDDVQAGALVAKSMIGRSPTIEPNLDQATKDLNLTPQEQALYQRHVTNLTGAGGVDNPNGSRSTLYQSSVEHDGKTYNIPTVWDGKILPIDDAVKRVQAEGWSKFPAYANEAEAEARYGKMHDYMERDTEQFLNARKSSPLYGVKPAIDDVGGLSDAKGDSLAKFKRDGVWVTSPDNKGLNLAYGDKFVRGHDGTPLFLSWTQLGSLGGTPEARSDAMKRATEFSGPTPLMSPGFLEGEGGDRTAAHGGPLDNGAPRFEDFRQSDNIEDRRRESNVDRHQGREASGYRLEDLPDLSAAERTALGQMLGIGDLSSEKDKYRERKQKMFDDVSRRIREMRRMGSDLPLPQRGRPYIQGPDE